ncbi:Putative transmembrane protein (PGPGW) [Desulfacinum infernum DSM 9756]|uniref:Putative transmembrane protein (PGPGW) n=1 Tax=Desulfacinum infernum DSM 9756 TaxID=1121391 RepID=A0A1M4X5J2_9BACT|nr:PGPGW domain-containing protein [Desulfacinum infernum]SHE88462.1 Putative transmembrane protein (PGPGW) [Desulfacinum infernum DSM 9756]
MKRTVRIVAGTLLLVLGVAGLFLPVLQGALFIALGLVVLGREIPWVARLLDRLAQRYPALDRWLQKSRQRRD